MSEPSDSSVIRLILETVRYENPRTIEELVDIVHERHKVRPKEIMECVLFLQEQGKLKLDDFPQLVRSGPKYFLSINAVWYWLVVFLVFANIFVSIFVVDLTSPFLYLRYAIGSLFLLFLPGYCLVEILFAKRKMALIERVALAIGMNITIVIINGFLLNFTSEGITLASTLFSLSVLTLIFSTIAVYRKYSVQT